MTLMRAIASEVLGTSIWEAIAVLLAVAYVVLAMRRNVWCWGCAFISSAIFVVLMAQRGLPMDALLNAYYVAMAIYGYAVWTTGKQDEGELQVITWRWRQHVLTVVVIVVLSSISSIVLQAIAPWLAQLAVKLGLGYVQVVRSPWLDSLVTWSSVITTWMVAKRVLENWLYWIVIDAVAAVLYYSRDLKATAVLFAVYVIMCVYGYRAWRKQPPSRVSAA